MKDLSALSLARLVTASATYRVLVTDLRTRVGMLPAGFEPASEARKAPILDRTRLRERNGRLAGWAINAFGTRLPRIAGQRKLDGAFCFRRPRCCEAGQASRNLRSSSAASSS